MLARIAGQRGIQRGVRSKLLGLACASAAPRIPKHHDAPSRAMATTAVVTKARNAPVLKVQPWTRDTASPDNVRKIVALPSDFLECFPVEELPLTLQKTFAFFATPSLMLRKSTLRLAAEISKAFSGDKSGPTQFVVDGVKGIGKSAALLQVVMHHHALKHVVIYIPRASVVINGTEPFVPRDEILYDQPALAASILDSIYGLNQHLLEEIKLSDAASGYANLGELVRDAATDPSKAHRNFDILMRELLDPQTAGLRPPVLIAVDQVNALYSVSEYHDVGSKPIEGHRFSIARTLLDLFKTPNGLPNAAIVGATDPTVHTAQPANLSRLQRVATEEMPELPLVVSHADVTPTTALEKQEWIGEKAVVFELPPLSTDEVSTLMEWYMRGKLMYRVELHRRLVERQRVMTGGTGQALFNSCLASRVADPRTIEFISTSVPEPSEHSVLLVGDLSVATEDERAEMLHVLKGGDMDAEQDRGTAAQVFLDEIPELERMQCG
ncbi:mitochondrial ribosomal death-associated protein 3-domain-containing protein [Cladochytrium replicatum]|nr:mitochondrial ribosomal death-associated protein 3-domain-containing protein [Cladochytrium replicatum]